MNLHRSATVHHLPWKDPLLWADHLANEVGMVWLDGGEGSTRQSRYSYIACRPFKSFYITLGQWLASDKTSPLKALELAMRPFKRTGLKDLPPFQGGFVGAFSYDLSRALFAWKQRHQAACLEDPLLIGGLYSLVIAFDHKEQRSYCFCNGWSEQGTDNDSSQAEYQQVLAWLEALPAAPLEPVVPHYIPADAIQSCLAPEAYEAGVIQVQEAIRAGEIFEANFTQRFEAPMPQGVSSWDLYRRLRATHHAPFGAYYHGQGRDYLSISPECFLRLEGNIVQTRPIKGTRPRGGTKEQDRALSDSLKNSAKDRCENIMIVDLMRNDLSKVCKPGSVQVEALCQLESYTTVHHLTSVVTGMLQADHSVYSLVEACFPPGSITGAPKQRAMEVLERLEPIPRGVYCGSIGYIGFDESLCLSVAIRTATVVGQDADRLVYFNAGGAVVLDSSPSEELSESHNKARAWKEALHGSA